MQAPPRNRPPKTRRSRLPTASVRCSNASASRRPEAFLAQYRAAAAQAPQPLVAPEHETALLNLFLIEKAAYEIRYEAANRPTWLGLPVRGLAGARKATCWAIPARRMFPPGPARRTRPLPAEPTMNERDPFVGLGASDIDALVEARHPDPFSQLGLHQTDVGPIVRVLVPNCVRCDGGSARKDGETLGKLTQVHPGGLFIGFVREDAPVPVTDRLARYPSGNRGPRIHSARCCPTRRSAGYPAAIRMR